MVIAPKFRRIRLRTRIDSVRDCDEFSPCINSALHSVSNCTDDSCELLYMCQRIPEIVIVRLCYETNPFDPNVDLDLHDANFVTSRLYLVGKP